MLWWKVGVCEEGGFGWGGEYCEWLFEVVGEGVGCGEVGGIYFGMFFVVDFDGYEMFVEKVC